MNSIIFEYTYKLWRGNCKNSPLPTIGSTFQCVKVDLPFCIDVCTCAYVLKWYSALFFFFWLKKVNIPTFVHWNYCSALPMVEPPGCSERYTNCLSIIYMYTQRVQLGLHVYYDVTSIALEEHQNTNCLFFVHCVARSSTPLIIMNHHSATFEALNSRSYSSGRHCKLSMNVF